jgi:O-6-methylguanine DNA methyltransferase
MSENGQTCDSIMVRMDLTMCQIVVPCHRVIAADGTLGGYGGGLDRKEWLLQLETAVS